jgi:hypothetical protein
MYIYTADNSTKYFVAWQCTGYQVQPFNSNTQMFYVAESDIWLHNTKYQYIYTASLIIPASLTLHDKMFKRRWHCKITRTYMFCTIQQAIWSTWKFQPYYCKETPPPPLCVCVCVCVCVGKSASGLMHALLLSFIQYILKEMLWFNQ